MTTDEIDLDYCPKTENHRHRYVTESVIVGNHGFTSTWCRSCNLVPAEEIARMSLQDRVTQ